MAGHMLVAQGFWLKDRLVTTWLCLQNYINTHIYLSIDAQSIVLWLDIPRATDVLHCGTFVKDVSPGNSWELWVYCMVALLFALFPGSSAVLKDRPFPPVLFAEWLNGPPDQMRWLYWAPSMLAVGSLKWLGCWPGCSPADPEPQTCSENSDLLWICPCHAILSAHSERAHSTDYYPPMFQ